MPVDPVPPATPTPSVVAVQAESLPPLLPCPFCGGTSIDVTDGFAACCNTCLADGPIKIGERGPDAAAKYWNHRASRSQAEAAREPMTDEQAEVILNSDARWINLVRAVERFHNIGAPLVSAGDEGSDGRLGALDQLP